MLESILFFVGVGVACFVAYNIGGATTGPAFAPAVGAAVVTKVIAAGLMSVFFFAGAWTIGRRVVDTLGQELVRDPAVFTLPASIVVLFFIGGALFVGNVFGVPASTSMTAVGSIAGLGLASGQLNWAVMGEIVSWWIVAPIIGFWVAGMIGRYFYVYLDNFIAIDQTDGPLVEFDRRGGVPRPVLGPGTTRRELIGSSVVVGIGCVMAFGSGTSNIANAIAPLVGSGQLDMNVGIVIGSVAVAAGALTIGRRTMETLGNDITHLPLTAAIVVATISSLLVIGLSSIGVPASFVVIATMSIVGLGWGRATRTTKVADSVQGREAPRASVGALAADEETATVGDPTISVESDPDPIGEEEPEEVPAASELFDPSTTARVVIMQNVVPIFATIGSYATFLLFFGVR
ncbi:inorganic phosphate transporter family protein [Natronomonas sp. F2-12]|jgi:PiT family inorganic phosphate transporter|uniref:Phosphate transporter n=1 Tax=Natronomonas aquatica TaxID=2841590 RepID=A0A9R1CPQ6_9EURY|nr:inorganic phosphate transporter [Natronomonas aquatica]MCQ4332738.1 inorganic phosphate transporter family protein [Natronomonas aquatica]